jgi:hypothetical protein
MLVKCSTTSHPHPLRFYLIKSLLCLLFILPIYFFWIQDGWLTFVPLFFFFFFSTLKMLLHCLLTCIGSHESSAAILIFVPLHLSLLTLTFYFFLHHWFSVICLWKSSCDVLVFILLEYMCCGYVGLWIFNFNFNSEKFWLLFLQIFSWPLPFSLWLWLHVYSTAWYYPTNHWECFHLV